MGIPTNNQPITDFAKDGEIKPPQIEWVHNDPKSTKHLPCADSSWLESISYDSTSMRMTINTKTGSSWQHAQVYPAQFTELQLHPSKGSYYTKNIKGNHPTTPIKKIAKLSNFPNRKEIDHVQKDQFVNPLHARFRAPAKGKRYS